MKNNKKQIVIEIDTDKQDLATIYYILNKWVANQSIEGYRTLDDYEKIELAHEKGKKYKIKNAYFL